MSKRIQQRTNEPSARSLEPMSTAPTQLAYRVNSLESGLTSLTEDVHRLTEAVAKQGQTFESRVGDLEGCVRSMTENVSKMSDTIGRQSQAFSESIAELGRDSRTMMEKHAEDNRKQTNDLYNKVGSFGKTNWQALGAWAAVLVAIASAGLAYVRLEVEPVRAASERNSTYVATADRESRERSSANQDKITLLTKDVALIRSAVDEQKDSNDIKHSFMTELAKQQNTIAMNRAESIRLEIQEQAARCKEAREFLDKKIDSQIQNIKEQLPRAH